MSKLTLNVDDDVAAGARRYAKKLDTTVSKLVERYLNALARLPKVPENDLSPITRRLSGIVKGAKGGRKEHLDYLARKYR
jgi:antitoxin component of RelBE/YafQ-DinJ toxin-antitoxin module